MYIVVSNKCYLIWFLICITWRKMGWRYFARENFQLVATALCSTQLWILFAWRDQSHFSFVEQHYQLVFIIANAAWVTRQDAADYVATTDFESPTVPRDICSLSPTPIFALTWNENEHALILVFWWLTRLCVVNRPHVSSIDQHKCDVCFKTCLELSVYWRNIKVSQQDLTFDSTYSERTTSGNEFSHAINQLSTYTS